MDYIIILLLIGLYYGQYKLIKAMPFKSKAQVRWMYANKPKMAEEWSKHTPNIKKLPKKKK
jgi:hypothetical protein